MVNPKIDLFIDRSSNDDSELEKWVAFVEKYLKYGLEQKGMKVDLVNWINPESTSISLYIPIFTKKSLLSEAYLERVLKVYQTIKSNNCIKIGLIKESVIATRYTDLFPDLKFLRMYLIDKDTGADIHDKDIWKKENHNYFLFKIFDLCSEVEREISNVVNSVADKPVKSVYLAETSPDLLLIREEVRRELLRHGYNVFPEKAITGTTKEVEKKINDFLQKSVLSVHLFGKFYQDTRPGDVQRCDLENRLAANFYSTKKENKKEGSDFKRIIWMPDNLVVSDEKQQRFLQGVQRDKKLYAGSEIITSTVEELKDIILEKLEEKEKKDDGGSSNSSEPLINKKRVVYVVVSEKNKEGAQSVKSMLENIDCEVVFDQGQRKSEFTDLKRCNSILFYYQNEKPSWLRSKMCEVYKIKKWDYSGTFVQRGILNFNNEDLPKDDFFKDVIHIKADQDLEQQNLISFFSSSVLK